MAAAIQLDGIDDYLSLNTGLSFLATTSYRIEFSIKIPSTTPNFTFIPIFGRLANDQSRVYVSTHGNNNRILINVRYTTSASTVQFDLEMRAELLDGAFHTYEIIRNGDTHTLFIDGIDKGSISSPNVAGLDIDIMGGSGSQRLDGLIEYVSVANTHNGAFDYNWSAADSDHSASSPNDLVLTDTIGGNYATGQNMPQDGSAWVDLGGGGSPVNLDIVVSSAKQVSRASTVSTAVQLALNANSAKQKETASVIDVATQLSLTTSSAKQIEKSSVSSFTIDSVVLAQSAKQRETASVLSLTIDNVIASTSAKQVERASVVDVSSIASIDITAISAKQVETAQVAAAGLDAVITGVSAKQVEQASTAQVATAYLVDAISATQKETSSVIEFDLSYVLASTSARQRETASFVSIIDGGLKPISADESHLVLIRTNPKPNLILTTPTKVVIQTTPKFNFMES